MSFLTRAIRAALLALLLPLFASAPAWAVPALVQSQSNDHYSVTSLTVTLNSVAAGDLVVLEVSYNDAEAPSSVTDSNGTPQAAVAFESSATQAFGIYYVPNAASGTHTFTVTVSTAASFYLFAEEFSGVATSSPLDGTMPSVSTGASTTPVSNSVTPSQSGDLAITGLTVLTATETFSSWTNGFALGSSGDTNISAAWAYQVYNSTSALTGGVTLNNLSNWGMGVVLFKSSSGGTPTTPDWFLGGSWSAPEVSASTSSTSVTPNCIFDVVKATASASGTFTINAPACSPVGPADGQPLELKIISPAGGALTYSWNAAYFASATLALPTTSNAASKEDYFTFRYDADKGGWVLLSDNQGF